MAIDPSGIERLIAAEQIRALKSRYFRFVDTQDWPTIRMHGFGHYHEEYRVEDGAWRIWRSTLTRLRMLNAF